MNEPVVDTLPKALIQMAQKEQRVAFREKHLGLWRDIPWAGYQEQVKFVALGFTLWS